MSDVFEFEKFPKIARLNREIIITEKIDGTNAQILIEPYTEPSLDPLWATPVRDKYRLGISNGCEVFAGSRTRFLTVNEDNFGFANWVVDNLNSLVATLGPGRHYGEWWGKGIQRGYNISTRRFSLFNVNKWASYKIPDEIKAAGLTGVPELWRGLFSEKQIKLTLDELRHGGSYAAPGFMNPEGIVIYHTHANKLFKVTLENDDRPKGADDV